MLFIVSAVLLSGSVIADAVDALPKKLERLLPRPSSEPSPLTNVKVPEALSPVAERDLMEQLGIRFDGERYHYQEYRYERLEDAVNYAKKSQKRA